MHIAYICREYLPSNRAGGIASYLKEVAENLVVKGHEVTVIAASDDTNREYTEWLNGVRIIRLSGGDFVIPDAEFHYFIRKFRPLYRFLSYRKRINSALGRLSNVDIIEVADYGAEALFLHGLGIPITVRLHTPAMFDRGTLGLTKLTVRNFPFYRNMKKELDELKRCDHISSCSDSLKHWAVNQVGIESSKIKVIYNPVNYDTFLKESQDENLLDRNMLNVVFVGTICETKGCGELVEACKKLKKVRSNLHLWLFGKEGTYTGVLRRNNADKEWIHVYGKVERGMLMSLYNHADVVCLPSWWDNMPMTCIEAMMSEAIVVASNSGGMSEMIEDGVDGFLCPPKDSYLLADVLDSVLKKSHEDKNIIRSKAKRHALQKFSSDVIVKQLLGYYNLIIRK